MCHSHPYCVLVFRTLSISVVLLGSLSPFLLLHHPTLPLFYSKLTSLDVFHLLACLHSLVIFHKFVEIFLSANDHFLLLFYLTSLYLSDSFTDILMGFWLEENLNTCARLDIFIWKFMSVFEGTFV